MVNQTIWQNAITPGVYIHIVTGRKAKDVLPKEPHYALPPTQEQINRLHNAGFHKIKSLTRKQAEYLLMLAINEYRQGRPEPWKIQALMNQGLGSHMSVKERYIWLRTTTRLEAATLLNL